MKKRTQLPLLCILVMALCTFLLSGCNTSLSYTYSIENGEQIKVTLDSSDGYKLSASGSHFLVYSNDKTLLTEGGFMFEEDKERYFEELPNADATGQVSILDQGSENEISYIFYYYDENGEEEWIYIIQINGVETGIQMVNTVSRESAEEVMSRLSFSADDD